jgi:multidrug resistance efflux pump
VNAGLQSAPDLSRLDASQALRTSLALLDEHSEDVQEVLGTPPHWLVRWGATLLVTTLLLLLVLTWIIHYPDSVPGRIVITTPKPPVAVVAQASGHLMDVTVHEGDHVERGAILARIQTAADPAAIEYVRSQLGLVAGSANHPLPALPSAPALALGDLQADYSAFVRAYEALGYYETHDPIGVQIRVIEPQRSAHRARFESLLRQRDLLAQEIALAERDVGRVEELARLHDATQLTVNDRERVLLQGRRTLEAVQLEMANTLLELERIQQRVVELSVRDHQQRQDLRTTLEEAAKALMNRLLLWDRTYVLRAPVAGVVSLFNYWSDSQFIRAGDEVMNLVPSGRQSPVGRMTITLARSGAVKPGQDVFIRVDNYPAGEYGLLRGVVRSISPVPREARYAIEVALSGSLTTTFGRKLEYRQEMQGSAAIVTEDLRLIERILYQFRDLFLPKPGLSS